METPKFSAESALYRSSVHYHTLASLAGTAGIEQLQLSPLTAELCDAAGLGLCTLDTTAATSPSTCKMTVGPSERITDFSMGVGDLTLVGQERANLRGLENNRTLTVNWAGATLLKLDSTLSGDGAYTTTCQYSPLVRGVREVRLITNDGKHIEGNVNGRQLTPFTAESRSVTFADGTPVPRPIFPPNVSSALQLVPTAVKKVLGTCTTARSIIEAPPRHSPSQLAITPASNGTSTYGSPPGIDDTANTPSCITCNVEADAAAAACEVACYTAFPFGCACLPGIPLLYVNCHAPGEELGKGCCPVPCGPSQTVLGIGVVYQCCYGGDSCFAFGAPVVGGSSTAAFCCGSGLQPCNQSICCPSDAPCRDVGICCPTNQATCMTNNGQVCCNPGEECIQGVCCPPGSAVCGDGTCCETTCHHCQGNSCVPVQDGTPCPTGFCCGGRCTACCGVGAGCISPGGCCSGFCNESNRCDCFGVGDDCRFGPQSCCSRLCSAGGTCCLPLKSNCKGPGDCCSGFCNESKQCDCFTTGDDCRFGPQSCCSGLCSAGGTCCLPLNSNCTGSGDCCSGFCNESKHCDCFATGDDCRFGPQSCCSGLCSAGGTCCQPVRSKCTNPGDCCSGFCNESNQCDCFAAGDECRLGAESCCSGVCGPNGLCR